MEFLKVGISLYHMDIIRVPLVFDGTVNPVDFSIVLDLIEKSFFCN